MAKKFFDKGQEGDLYRRAWGRVLLRGIALTAAANAIMTLWDEQDDEGNQLSYWDAMQRRFSKGWDIGRLRWAMIDITPFYHAIGGPADKRAYFSVFGAYFDPIRMIESPGDFLESKGSFVTKTPLEYFTAQNWQHKEFTRLDELLGMDDKGMFSPTVNDLIGMPDKGTYSKTQEGHKAGDINPNTGEPYKRDQAAHEEGEFKGGKLRGQLTKWPVGGAHPVTYQQLPSFILNEVRGMMPNAVQSGWQIANGENDWTTSILNAIGSRVLTDKEPKKKDDE
jgi:hypothetical protein